MRAALLVFTCVWWGGGPLTTGLMISLALHAPTISLEEYGVVHKPGCMMSTADVTHVQQGFRVPIPRLDSDIGSEVPVLTLCKRYLKFGLPFEKVCESMSKVRNWLRATVDSLMEVQRRIINQAMESLPRDDRQWVMEIDARRSGKINAIIPPITMREALILTGNKERASQTYVTCIIISLAWQAREMSITIDSSSNDDRCQ